MLRFHQKEYPAIVSIESEVPDTLAEYPVMALIGVTNDCSISAKVSAVPAATVTVTVASPGNVIP